MKLTDVLCPVCGKYEFECEFDVCRICEWQHNKVQQKDHDFRGGANRLSVNDYRADRLKKSNTAVV